MLNFGFKSSGGLVYPPVKGNLLAWIRGNLIDGVDLPYSVDNPGELYSVDPVAEEYGIYRRDMYTVLGNFPMRVSNAHCVTLNGTDDYIDMGFRVLPGNNIFSCSVDLATFDAVRTIAISGAGNAVNGWYIVVDNATSFRLNGNISGGSTPLILTVNDISAVKNIRATFINTSANNYDVTLEADGNSISTSMQIDPPTIDIAIGTNASRSGNFLNGSLWNMAINGEHFPMSEGFGSTIHSSNGSNTGTSIGTGSTWGSFQNSYFYNLVEGYWDNGDGVKYPSDPGSAVFMRGGAWNGSENKYTFYEPIAAEIIAQDNLEGPFFTDGVSVGIPKTEAEITAYAADKDATFMSACVPNKQGLSLYDEIQTGDNLFNILKYNCEAEAVTDGGEIVTDGGEIVYVRF